VNRYVTANVAKNLVIQGSTGKFIVLVEMDVLVRPGWLEHLVTACLEFPADVASPLILEKDDKVHGNERLWRVSDEADGYVRILPRETDKELDRSSGRQRLDLVEDHCLCFRRSSFERMGLLDNSITTRFEIDCSMALRQAGLTAVLEPKSQVYFVEPPPVEPEERDFFLFRYDKRAAKKSEALVADRWKIQDLPSTRRFIKRRLRVLEHS
jgi:GT2 family glycosyltransferase